MFSAKNMEDALVLAKQECNIDKDFELKDAQMNLLCHFLNGNDCMGVLPTGYGKSIIYQLAPVVARNLNPTHFSKEPVLIVVSPINALIDDQIASCAKLNLKAKKLCSETLTEIIKGDIDLIYSSPECLLSDDFREILLSEIYKGRIMGIAVDEAHLIVKW